MCGDLVAKENRCRGDNTRNGSASEMSMFLSNAVSQINFKPPSTGKRMARGTMKRMPRCSYTLMAGNSKQVNWRAPVSERIRPKFY
jgi:hypothetical protein